MKLIIIGGGFGGLRLARKLSNRSGFEITLLDKFNYHQFQPLFYQVATANLDASNISFPLRKIFQKSKNVRIRVSKMISIDTSLNKVNTETGIIEFDKLVIATGADTNYCDNKQVMEQAFPMKSKTEALKIRHWLIQNFEEILVTTDATERERRMTVVICGGGPTGVEMSGAIAEMKRYNLPS